MTVFFLRVFDVLSSMRFGVFCLSLFFVIVLLGTFAQIEHGIFYTQSQYFHSWFLLVPFGSVRLPVFPGGALVGMLLVINLILGSVFRIKWSWKKCGLLLVHVGMIVLLLGASLTSCISHESQVYLEEGDSAYFSHDLHDNELVIIDASSVNYDRVIAIPWPLLLSGDVISDVDLPFDVYVDVAFRNAQISQPSSEYINSAVSEGIGRFLRVTSVPLLTRDDVKNNPTCIVRFVSSSDKTGAFLFSFDINGLQRFSVDGRDYYAQIRARREYFPFNMTLNTFSHDRYPGSDIPKNFSSLVTLSYADETPEREVLIYMNHPLREHGLTFFQASFGEQKPSSVLQVVNNPLWQVPYWSCLVIALGLSIHFLVGLGRFLRRRSS